MKSVTTTLFAIAVGLALGASAAPLTLRVPKPQPAGVETFDMGTARNPAGSTVSLDRRSLLLDGQPWTPVMGEFHYSRYPANEWRQELRKMRAGGIDIVATYVFWIHHEEIEGQWEWAGDKNLREFVRMAGEVGLKVIVRCGPWCHGEVRNGGLPDWLVARGKTRTEDPAFLESTTKLYRHIADQLNGLLWKDGGPVIGIQLDNEYGGPAEYLLALKRIARDVGLDVPLYTRTGWPALKTPMPFGEIVPLYGVYAEGFWDRELTTMPGKYWAGFHFSTLRVDNNIANEALGRRDTKDADDVARYPYLTCEIGGGMMSAYHRRIVVDPRDITSTTLVKLGSGSVSPGYYMYHGGTNPEGKRTTLMEEQSTAITNWNDMPVKNYDFQAPLGQYGQERRQFYTLRPLHLFLQSFGAKLAGMATVLPDVRPAGKDDTETLRWAVRGDRRGGFLFVNNYERGKSLSAKEGVQFDVYFPDTGHVTFPTDPVRIESGAHFIWPINLDLGHGVKLAWATYQPIARVEEPNGDLVYFFKSSGAFPGEFAFTGARIVSKRNPIDVLGDGYTRVRKVVPSYEEAMVANSKVRIYVLAETEAMHLFLKPVGGAVPGDLPFEPVRPAGPLRKIEMGKSPKPVAAAPVAADFAAAAVWRVKLPSVVWERDDLLRFFYTGDVARISIGDEFITDDYYNGQPLEIGVRRHAAALKASGGEITIAVLPLQRNAPIYLPDSAQPDFKGADSIASLNRVDVAPMHQIEAEEPLARLQRWRDAVARHP